MHALTDRRLCLFYHIDILFRHLLICHVDRLRISQTGIPPLFIFRPIYGIDIIQHAFRPDIIHNAVSVRINLFRKTDVPARIGL